VRGIRRSGWLLAVLLLAGCGGGADYKNAPRPPAPINVTAAIDDHGIRVSPDRFGAGPIVITVSNQSSSRQALTFETDELAGQEPGLRATTTPIDPLDTATLQVDVREGTYRLRTKSRAIRPASVNVGKQRPSAQDQLLQP
jgi:hypothetical protein